jgi:ankyrin repeat protein
LLIKGAIPSIQTIDDYTPLQLSIQHHAHSIAEVLLSHHKIDVNQVTAHGTALHLAVKNEDVRCIELLLQNDADIEVQDQDGKTAL